jgi:hypothetical protein
VTRRYENAVSASDITDEWWQLLDPDSDTPTGVDPTVFDAGHGTVGGPHAASVRHNRPLRLGLAGVTLQSAIEAELPFLRVEAEARMTDTCRVTAPGVGTRGALNQTTGKYSSAPAGVTVYEGAVPPGPRGDPHMSRRRPAATLSGTCRLGAAPADRGHGDGGAGCTVSYLTSSIANPALEGRSFGVVGVVAAPT